MGLLVGLERELENIIYCFKIIYFSTKFFSVLFFTFSVLTPPSDINQKQFELILPILESARKKTKPRTVDLYDVFCGLLYVLRTGCQWRQLPHDFPKWRTVHSYFQKWSELDEEGNSILDQALKKIGQKSAKEGQTQG